MAVTKAQADKVAEAQDPAVSAGTASSVEKSAQLKPGETRTDDNVTQPSTVAPGDAPADTLDPTERVSTVPHRPGLEALAVGTVNAVLVNPALPTEDEVAHNLRASRSGATATAQERVEEYDARRPDGSTVRVRHNLDTGETSAS
jgi:hypothetical protein